MGDGAPLQVEVKVNSDGAVRGLKIVSSSVTDAADLMRSSLAKAAAAAEVSTKEMGGSLEGVVEHIRGMRSEMRLGNFMAMQLAEMGLAAKGTASEVTGLFAAMALGGPIGVGIEAIKILVTSFTELGKEEEKAREEFAKWVEDLEKGTKQVEESVTAELMAINGATKAEIAAHKNLMPLLDERLKWQAKEKQATEDLATIRARDLVTEQDSIEKINDENEALKRQAEAREHLATLAHEFVARAEPVVELGDAEEREKAKKAAKDAAEAAHQLALDEANIDVARLAEVKRHNDQVTAETTKWLEKQDKAELDAAKTVMDAGEKIAAQNEKNREERAKRISEFEAEQAKKTLKAQEDLAKGITSAFGTMFGEIVAGSNKSAGEMLKNLIVAITKSIEAYALQAMAASAAAHAWNPIAMVAMASAAFAFVEGLIGSLPSAAGGWEIPTSVGSSGVLMVGHGGEKMLPADKSEKLDNLLDNGAGMGGGTINVYAMDAQSFLGFARRNKGSLALVLREMAQDGRI